MSEPLTLEFRPNEENMNFHWIPDFGQIVIVMMMALLYELIKETDIRWISM